MATTTTEEDKEKFQLAVREFVSAAHEKYLRMNEEASILELPNTNSILENNGFLSENEGKFYSPKGEIQKVSKLSEKIKTNEILNPYDLVEIQIITEEEVIPVEKEEEEIVLKEVVSKESKSKKKLFREGAEKITLEKAKEEVSEEQKSSFEEETVSEIEPEKINDETIVQLYELTKQYFENISEATKKTLNVFSKFPIIPIEELETVSLEEVINWEKEDKEIEAYIREEINKAKIILLKEEENKIKGFFKLSGMLDSTFRKTIEEGKRIYSFFIEVLKIKEEGLTSPVKSTEELKIEIKEDSSIKANFEVVPDIKEKEESLEKTIEKPVEKRIIEIIKESDLSIVKDEELEETNIERIDIAKIYNLYKDFFKELSEITKENFFKAIRGIEDLLDAYEKERAKELEKKEESETKEREEIILLLNSMKEGTLIEIKEGIEPVTTKEIFVIEKNLKEENITVIPNGGNILVYLIEINVLNIKNKETEIKEISIQKNTQTGNSFKNFKILTEHLEIKEVETFEKSSDIIPSYKKEKIDSVEKAIDEAIREFEKLINLDINSGIFYGDEVFIDSFWKTPDSATNFNLNVIKETEYEEGTPVPVSVKTKEEALKQIEKSIEIFKKIHEEGLGWGEKKFTIKEIDTEIEIYQTSSQETKKIKPIYILPKYVYCAGVIAYCFRNSIKRDIRRKIMPSTYRMFANWRQTKRNLNFSSKKEEWHSLLRKFKTIKNDSEYEMYKKEIKEFLKPFVKKGNIVAVYTEEKKYGSHVVLIENEEINIFPESIEDRNNNEVKEVKIYLNVFEGDTYSRYYYYTFETGDFYGSIKVLNKEKLSKLRSYWVSTIVKQKKNIAFTYDYVYTFYQFLPEDFIFYEKEGKEKEIKSIENPRIEYRRAN